MLWWPVKDNINSCRRYFKIYKDTLVSRLVSLLGLGMEKDDPVGEEMAKE